MTALAVQRPSSPLLCPPLLAPEPEEQLCNLLVPFVLEKRAEWVMCDARRGWGWCLDERRVFDEREAKSELVLFAKLV
ncbi:hypothetical protein LshimejAT787_0702450 [Lyophyllum shimeji]|uniref:Uncharacterized protein n=1 Tax=Lyophyllum shimeji TaxID=47721 RepID=A0A9P3PNL5_LYOSH|nr:hypothetical protein LshimejAT787_0702450 [Lyophyllum shimeji]